jgi:hypothetical protein
MEEPQSPHARPIAEGEKGYTMPAEEIMHKFYHRIPMSNGKRIKSLAQAKAIASQYGSGGDEEKKTKKFTYVKKG